jgi:arsenite/tail-anchored protein-transporting ATPase
VNGFSNLFCMELDPTVDLEENADALAAAGVEAAGGAAAGARPTTGLSSFIKEFSTSIPGIDELVSFAELIRHVTRLEFDVTVFDTAPTGHTLRLLSLPGMADKLLQKVMGLRSTFGPMLTQMQALMGGAASGLPSEETIVAKLDEFKATIDAVQKRIHAADETTFVCVCIPEFLSL